MTVREQIPTAVQLDVSNARMLTRGLVRRCPACGARPTHSSYMKMLRRCPQCDLKFERIFGHSLGYIGLNTIVTFSATFVVLLVGSILTMPDIPVWPLVIAILLTSVVLPIVFLPSAHTTWTAIDLILRPLEPGEIDPRFVRVDPEVGDWHAA